VDAVYTNVSVIPIGGMAALWLGRPHVWHIREFGDRDFQFYFNWGERMDRWFLRRATARIAVSAAVRSHVLPGCSEACQTRVVYNGVVRTAELDRLHGQARETRGIRQPYTFLMVGAVYPRKGQMTAIQALAALRRRSSDARLVIVGEGQVAECQELAAELGVADRVEFWGYQPDPAVAYRAADAVLMLSPNEAMGRVTVEAMAACRPVIGYDNAGTSELIQHEQNGLLYQDGVEALVACMERCVRSPEWARELGEQGWESVRGSYTVETYARQVYAILERAAQGKRTHPALGFERECPVRPLRERRGRPAVEPGARSDRLPEGAGVGREAR
jgi:glycosyltransferase involved in cell wall biosynthesis